MRTSAITLAAATLLIALTACGGGSSKSSSTPPPPPAVAITVAQASASIFTTQTDQFTATVTGTANPAVTWSIQEGSTGGTISASGLYTAPAAANTYHVIATSQADTTKSATGAVAVTVPSVTFSTLPAGCTTLAQGILPYSCQTKASDAAGSKITYSLTISGPATGTATISSTTGLVSWMTLANASDRLMPSIFTVKATNAAGASNTQFWTLTPLRLVTVNFIDSSWIAGATNPSPGPLESLVSLGAIVPGSTATPCVTGTQTVTLCAASLTSITGIYAINNVPAGYYWLVNGPTEKYWTNVSTFDGATDFIGQLISAPITAQLVDITGLTLVATSAPDVLSTDVIWIGSPNTTAWWAPQTALPPTGTTLTDTTESIAAGTLPAINSGPTPDDPSWVLQFSAPAVIAETTPSVLGFVGMSIAADESLGTSFSYASTVAGTLTASAPQTLGFTTTHWGNLIPAATYTLLGGPTVPRMVYFGTYLASLPYTTAPLAAIGGGYPSCSSAPPSGVITVTCTEAPGLVGWPAYTTTQPDSAILGTPHGQNTREAGGDFGPLFLAYAALDSSTCSASPTTDCIPPDGDTVSMPVENAFSSTGWPMVLSSQVEVQVPLGYTDNFSTVSTSQFSVPVLSSAIVDQPVIYPVTAPTINGGSLFTTPTTSLSAPLTLNWTAAALNTAVSGNATVIGYDVMVYAAPSGSSSWSSVLADLATTNPPLIVPTLGLPAGTYVVVIQARADANATLTASPWHSKYPKGTAQIVSAPFTITGSW